jgi:hypothetical protein
MKLKAGILLIFVLVTLAGVAVMAAGPPKPPPGPCCWPPVSAPMKLVNWWTFNEPAGTTSADFGGSVNNIGTDHGAITRPFGVSYRSLSLQGSQWAQVASGNEVNFGGSCSTNNAESGTIAFWISTASASSANGVVTILDKRDATPNNLRGYSVYLWNGRLGFQMATGAGNRLCNSAGSACSNFIATSLPSVADGKWHFVAISFSRCNNPTGLFYVDGQAVPFTPRVGDLSSSSDLLIGRIAPPLGNSHLNGGLDELMYFKFAYTKADLDAIFNDKCHNSVCLM